MTSEDAALLARFEAQAIPREEWTHRAHVKVAYLYATSYPFDEAIVKLREGIKALNAVLEVPEGPLMGYNETTTHALLHLVPSAYRTRIDEALLAALALSMRRWGSLDRFWVDLEGHGREGLFDDVDLSRTVGCVSTFYPVLVDTPLEAAPQDALLAMKRELRAIPEQGITYGILRHAPLETETAARLRAIPPAEVTFNYLGQADVGQADPDAEDAALFAGADEDSGPARSPPG